MNERQAATNISEYTDKLAGGNKDGQSGTFTAEQLEHARNAPPQELALKYGMDLNDALALQDTARHYGENPHQQERLDQATGGEGQDDLFAGADSRKLLDGALEAESLQTLNKYADQLSDNSVNAAARDGDYFTREDLQNLGNANDQEIQQKFGVSDPEQIKQLREAADYIGDIKNNAIVPLDQANDSGTGTDGGPDDRIAGGDINARLDQLREVNSLNILNQHAATLADANSEDGKGSGVFTSDDLTAIQGEDLKALGERLGIPAQEAQLLQAAVAYLNSDDNRQNALDSAGGGNGADNIYASPDIEARLNELLPQDQAA